MVSARDLKKERNNNFHLLKKMSSSNGLYTINVLTPLVFDVHGKWMTQFRLISLQPF